MLSGSRSPQRHPIGHGLGASRPVEERNRRGIASSRFFLSLERRDAMPNDLFSRACRAYAAHCSRHGYLYRQPARGGVRAQGFFLLTNCRGVLHAFRERNGRLRTVDLASVPQGILGDY